jgi:hypothetical protein
LVVKLCNIMLKYNTVVVSRYISVEWEIVAPQQIFSNCFILSLLGCITYMTYSGECGFGRQQFWLCDPSFFLHSVVGRDHHQVFPQFIYWRPCRHLFPPKKLVVPQRIPPYGKSQRMGKSRVLADRTTIHGEGVRGVGGGCKR